MYTTEKLMQMLTSKKASVRYDACEWLRVRQDSSAEIVRALDRVTNDEDKEVAERARYALRADVHYQMAIEMGLIRPDNTGENRKIIAPPLSNGKFQAGPIILFFIGTMVVFVSFIDFVNTLAYRWQRKGSESWPSTKGEVISTDVKTFNDEYGNTSYPVITYRYTVLGSKYSCTISADEKTEWDLYHEVQVGSAVVVNYHPEKPEICVSEYDTANTGSPWNFLFPISLGSLFAWIGFKGLVG